jgi:L-asparaginase II
VSETTIHGAVAWVHGDEPIHSFGGNVLCYGRSMMKLLYLKPFTEALAPVTNWAARAISVASHNGTPDHIAAAQSLLEKEVWGLMQTPLDLPLVQFGRQVRRPRRWYNNSSGHHAAIIRGCLELGWNPVRYTLPSHPVFQAYLDVIRRCLGPDWTPLRIARDGDGLPTVSSTVTELARCYALLAKERSDDWIWESMIRQPDLVGGFNRLDTTIITARIGHRPSRLPQGTRDRDQDRPRLELSGHLVYRPRHPGSTGMAAPQPLHSPSTEGFPGSRRGARGLP